MEGFYHGLGQRWFQCRGFFEKFEVPVPFNMKVLY